MAAPHTSTRTGARAPLTFALAALLAGCGSSTAQSSDAGSDAAADAAVRQHVSGVSVGSPQDVLAPSAASACAAPPECSGSSSINCYGGLSTLADEHSTVMPPGALPGHASDYLFFVPTKTCLNGDATAATGSTSGLVVLTGGSGPDANGRWTLDFPQDFDSYDEMIGATQVQGHGQIFLSPMDRTSCPPVGATSQDPTFDLNYANPGTVVLDPTKSGSPDAPLMIYEGTNRCVGFNGAQDDKFYSTLGVATTRDYGHTWPSYRASHTPLPEQSLTAGPGAALGATGPATCEGNDCTSTPLADYGRYAVLGAPVTLASFIATGQPLPTKDVGDSEPSAFVDDVNTTGGTYLYTIENFSAGGYAYPGTQGAGYVGVARAKLGGSGPLAFTKWYGASVAYGATSSGSFAPTTVTVTGTSCGPGSTSTTSCQISNGGLGSDGGGLESAIFPQDPSNGPGSVTTCQRSDQGQLGAAISYVDATQEYLLTFICNSPVDPADPSAPPPSGATRGAAWFYATLDATRFDLSRQDQWSAPQEISGSWAWFTSNATSSGCPPKGCSSCVHDGWYPTWMSLATKLGHVSPTGYVFSMKGCQDVSAGGPRAYVSRTFTLALSP